MPSDAAAQHDKSFGTPANWDGWPRDEQADVSVRIRRLAFQVSLISATPDSSHSLIMALCRRTATPRDLRGATPR